MENLIIKNSSISGKGVFAKINIKKGERIYFLRGEKINLKEAIRRANDGKENTSDVLQIGPTSYLDLEEKSRLFNHSCEPNAYIKGERELIALCDISKGQEITYDYSCTMDDNYRNASRSIWTNNCKCGKTNCRKSIDQFRLLPKRIRNFYLKNNLAQNFILRKFKTLMN